MAAEGTPWELVLTAEDFRRDLGVDEVTRVCGVTSSRWALGGPIEAVLVAVRVADDLDAVSADAALADGVRGSSRRVSSEPSTRAS